MLVDLKSRAKRVLTIQLHPSMASPRHPMRKMLVRRSRVVRLQAEPVPHYVERAVPPTMTIRPGETVKNLPLSVLDLEQVKHAVRAKELVSTVRRTKAPKPMRARPHKPLPPAPPPAPEKPEDGGRDTTRARARREK